MHTIMHIQDYLYIKVYKIKTKIKYTRYIHSNYNLYKLKRFEVSNKQRNTFSNFNITHIGVVPDLVICNHRKD